jgi:arylsulfatase A-like enzyme
VRGDRETQRVRDRLEALREGERPWALLAHYMDTHRPYQAKRFGWRARTETESYRAAVAFLDEQVGALLDALREAGAYDEALVVFTADHGEELTEDRLPGDYDHGHTLHRELLRVPLIVKLPGGRRAGERRSDDASLIDVAPSVLGVLGVAAPHSFRGIDLLADGAAERAAERTLIAESLLHVPEQKAAIRAGYKVMLRSLPPRREAAEAFDLSHDANELHPLPVTGDPRFEPLYHAIEAHVAAAPPGRRRAGAPALDPQLRRDLEALGYAR